MRFYFKFRIILALLFVLLGIGSNAKAQSFGFSATNSASSVLVSNSVSYTINVTNLTGLGLVDVVVTNLLPASVQPLTASTTQGAFTNYGSVVVFDLGGFPAGQAAVLNLTVQPIVAGYFTNTITVSSINLTNTVTTNLVTLATNFMIQADLGVAMTGSAQPVITNDWMTYGVTAFNLGSNAAPGVMLTNTLPSGAILKAVSPSNLTYLVITNNLVFNLGTFPGGYSTNLQFTVQPTNAGVLTFAAAIGAANVIDNNLTNNSASTNIAILSYPVAILLAATNSGQTINQKNGLEEQSILLSNLGTNDVAAARIVISGLTKQLFNAVGTNGSNPFVTLGAPLAAGDSVSLLLQYNPRGSFPFTNGQLHAFAVPLPNWMPPATTATSTNINISRIVPLTNGMVLLEWPATANRTYTVVYSDNVLFSNAMIAPPAIAAPANEMQWIDYGPPTTISLPGKTGARFYRVFLNP